MHADRCDDHELLEVVGDVLQAEDPVACGPQELVVPLSAAMSIVMAAMECSYPEQDAMAVFGHVFGLMCLIRAGARATAASRS